MLMVREFLDIFLEELLGLPPDKEVEFEIKVLLSTRPIFIPPCKITPANFKELKELL